MAGVHIAVPDQVSAPSWNHFSPGYSTPCALIGRTLIVSHTNGKSAKLDEADKTALGFEKKNFGTLAGRHWQTGAQGAIAKDFHGKGRMIDPSVYYKNGDVNVTVFGVRIHSKWKFFYQTFKRNAGKYEFVGFYDFERQSKKF